MGTLSDVALLCDYFTAASAADARAALDWPGGPSSAARHRTVTLPGMEPTTWMGKLELVLTGRTFDEVLRDPTGGVTAFKDGGERLIVAVTSSLQDALASLGDSQIAAVATTWARPDDFFGTTTNQEVAERALRALIDLVRAGRADGESLYCWVCV